MTVPDPLAWQPLPTERIQETLGDFREWALGGGQSLDWIVGRTTRTHGDTDIGVFLCDNGLVAWDGLDIPARVHDIWIADASLRFWSLQIVVYDDEDDTVIYRRDPRIRWSKMVHSLALRGMNVVNPMVTLLFKFNKSCLDPKDCEDARVMIEHLAAQAAQPSIPKREREG